MRRSPAFLVALGILALDGGAEDFRRPPVASRPAGRAAARELRIGTVSATPGTEIQRFLPLCEYLSPRLRDEGIAGVKVVVAKDLGEIGAWMKEGTVDLFVDSPFPSLLVRRLSGSRFLLRRWKKGVSEYRAVLFARKDSGLGCPEDLRGRTIAFEESYSSAGYFFPKARLLERGLRLLAQKEVAPPAEPGSIGYVFSGSDENTVVWVLRGKVAAGATDNVSLAEYAKGNLDRLVVLDEGPPLPRQVVSVRPDLPPGLTERVRGLLRGMEASEEGRAALEKFERTARFDELPAESLAHLAAFEAHLDREVTPR